MKCYYCHNESNSYPLIFNINPISYTLVSEFIGEITESTGVICDKCYVPFLLRKKDKCDICGSYSDNISQVNENKIRVGYCSPFFEHIRGIWKINPDKVGSTLDGIKEICNQCLITVIKTYDCVNLSENEINSGTNCVICTKNSFREECEIYNDNTRFVRCARIVRRNIFNYPQSGLYCVVGDTIPFNEGSICNVCLDKYRYRKYMEAECDICHKNYQSTMISRNEGIACCSKVNDDCINVGEYSRFYSDIIFTKIKPEYLDYKSTICDICIQELIDGKVCKLADKSSLLYGEMDGEMDGEIDGEIDGEMDSKIPGTLVTTLIKSAKKK